MIYIICENEAFCARVMLPSCARISHTVHVRYIDGWEKPRCNGSWLLNVLGRLGSELFVTDPSLDPDEGDKAAIQLYPELGQIAELPKLDEIRHLKGKLWSKYGDVSWFKVS